MADVKVIIILMIIFVAGTSQATTLSKSYCTASQYGTYRVALQFCDGRNWRNHLQQQGRASKTSQGKSCLDIKNKGLSYGDGEYIIEPDGNGRDKTFPVFCDMSSFGGGWTMCYTADNHVNLKSELTTSSLGYRADCNNIPFTQVMFVDEKTKQKAAFTKQGSAVTFSGNYNKKADAYGLWTAQGVATTQYKYQMLICNTAFYKGLHFSGYTRCYKQCDNWCGDTASPYFRTSATSKSYNGVAFNENGHKPRPSRLISAGIR